MKNLIDFILENKGHDFEKFYIDNFEEKYRHDLEKLLGFENNELENCLLQQLGGKNSSRPLITNGDKLLIGTKNVGKTVGDDVVDVLLTKTIDDKLYSLNLSLKFGKTITFLNCGISQAFPEKCFDVYKNTGEFIPQKNNKYNGNTILDFFGIDHNRFAEVFTNYKKTKRKSTKDFEIVTNKIDKNNFLEFIRTIVGYGYILIHEIGNKIYYTDLRNESDMLELVGNTINTVEVYYPNDGGSKTVTVIAELEKTIFTFQFRNKHGDIYPADLTVNFIKKEL